MHTTARPERQRSAPGLAAPRRGPAFSLQPSPGASPARPAVSPRSDLPSEPGAPRLRALFERSGLRLSDLQVQQFWVFHQLLRRRNVALDLTRLHAFDTIVLKHYVDCALVATLVDLPSPLLDLGSGAGFPGIPLKIVRPDVRLLLAEGRAKRVAFLAEAIRELGLRDIEVVPHRIGPRFDRPVRGVITRAVASIPVTLARLAPWLQPGAHVLFMKGPGADPELEIARRDWSAEFRVARDLPYSIPATPHVRRLVVLERSAHLSGAHTVAPGTGSTDASNPSGTPRKDADWWDADMDDEESELLAPDSAPDPEAAGTEGAMLHGAGSIAGREVREIASAANPTYKLLRAVLTGRGLRKHHRAVLAGGRPILEVVRDFPDRALAWITPGATPAPPADAPRTLVWYRLNPQLFREIDTFGTGPPLLLVEAPSLPVWTDADWPPGCTLFVPFQDPENVGAVVRTAAAFGVARVVFLLEAAHPFHPRSARAAGSALLRIPMLRGPSVRDLAPSGAPVYSLSPGGRDVAGFLFPERFGLLVGLEGTGVPDRWREEAALGVPMQPGNESLNAAAAASIVLYLWSRQRA